MLSLVAHADNLITIISGIADLANNYKGLLSADEGCKYDELIEINLSEVT